MLPNPAFFSSFFSSSFLAFAGALSFAGADALALFADLGSNDFKSPPLGFHSS